MLTDDAVRDLARELYPALSIGDHATVTFSAGRAVAFVEAVVTINLAPAAQPAHCPRCGHVLIGPEGACNACTAAPPQTRG